MIDKIRMRARMRTNLWQMIECQIGDGKES